MFPQEELDDLRQVLPRVLSFGGHRPFRDTGLFAQKGSRVGFRHSCRKLRFGGVSVRHVTVRPFFEPTISFDHWGLSNQSNSSNLHKETKEKRSPLRFSTIHSHSHPTGFPQRLVLSDVVRATEDGKRRPSIDQVGGPKRNIIWLRVGLRDRGLFPVPLHLTSLT